MQNWRNYLKIYQNLQVFIEFSRKILNISRFSGVQPRTPCKCIFLHFSIFCPNFRRKFDNISEESDEIFKKFWKVQIPFQNYRKLACFFMIWYFYLSIKPVTSFFNRRRFFKFIKFSRAYLPSTISKIEKILIEKSLQVFKTLFGINVLNYQLIIFKISRIIFILNFQGSLQIILFEIKERQNIKIFLPNQNQIIIKHLVKF